MGEPESQYLAPARNGPSFLDHLSLSIDKGPVELPWKIRLQQFTPVESRNISYRVQPIAADVCVMYRQRGDIGTAAECGNVTLCVTYVGAQ